MSDQTINPKLSPQQQQFAVNALRAAVPNIYANGFGVATSASDFTVILMLNNNPIALMSLAPGSAKTLCEELSKAVSGVEKATGQKIKSIAEVAQELAKTMGEAHVKPV